jgi:methylase of polypeptide subunit release factors
MRPLPLLIALSSSSAEARPPTIVTITMVGCCYLSSSALPSPGGGRRRAVRSLPPRGYTATSTCRTSAGGGDRIDKNHDGNAMGQSASGGRSSTQSQGSHRCAVDRRDTSAAARILASGPAARRMLAGVGRPYRSFSSQSSNDDEQRRRRADSDAAEDRGQCRWEGDVWDLRDVLDRSRYRHPALRERIFGLRPPPGRKPHPPEDGGNDGDRQRSSTVGLREGDYPMGPSYVRPLVAGQGFDLERLIVDSNCSDGSTSGVSSTGTKDDDGDGGWLGSLRCLAALFLLASCVPKRIFIEHVIGGDETLELMLRLGVVFVYDDEWVVPLVHLFPLEIPPIRSTSPSGLGRCHADDDSIHGKNIVLMTDLHPNVLGTTSLDRFHDDGDDAAISEEKGDEEGAVMYIGPDSLALIHHLHASMSNFVVRDPSEVRSPFGRILDVCAGSGVQALAAIAMLESLEGAILADAEPIAVAVDVNERALRFTTFNAHLNGYKGKIVTVHADLLSGRTNANCESLTEALLNEMANFEKHHLHSQLMPHKDHRKFSLILANPPFIPVPPSRSDYPALSLRKEGVGDNGGNTPRYGLFSSGGPNGEDCLREIVRMAPSLLRSDGGLLAVVSEFMNPPPPLSKILRVKDGEDMKLTSKLETWWGSQLVATGILFTNENAISSDLYAQRRAMRNDLEDINVWTNHLSLHGIISVSPGLLFIQTIDGESLPGEGRQRLALKHQFVPKTDLGSIWTPHNVDAVKFTRDILMRSYASDLDKKIV